jgi:hypothetical protein
VPFVVQVRPAIAANEPSPRRKGTLVTIGVFQGPECKTQGLLCEVLNLSRDLGRSRFF